MRSAVPVWGILSFTHANRNYRKQIFLFGIVTGTIWYHQNSFFHYSEPSEGSNFQNLSPLRPSSRPFVWGHNTKLVPLKVRCKWFARILFYASPEVTDISKDITMNQNLCALSNILKHVWAKLVLSQSWSDTSNRWRINTVDLLYHDFYFVCFLLLFRHSALWH